MKTVRTLIFGMLAFLGLAAFAQITQPETVEKAVGLLPMIYEAFKSGQTLMAAALLTLVIVFVVRQYVLPKLNVSAALLPLVSLIVGALSALAISVASGATLQAAAMALMAGPLASSLWSVLIKYFFDPTKLA
jgi:hypothetical protein